MKKLLLISVLLLSSTSFAGWTWVSEATSGTQYYMDYERIKKNNGYHYFYLLMDLSEPDRDGDLSYSLYQKIDCSENRLQNLSEFYYTQPMGQGNLTSNNVTNPKWEYPPPGSMMQTMLEEVCEIF